VAVVLDQPADDDDIYEARGAEVSPARPLLTGDVLRGVPFGGADDQTVMVVAHPCTMRLGVVLAEKVVCARVARYPYVATPAWSEGHMRVCPLPSLLDGAHYACHLDDLCTVEADPLANGERIACLQQRAVFLLQQRLIACMTRCRVELATIRLSMGGVLAEAELQEEWVERLSEDLHDAGANETEVAAFDSFISDRNRREALGDGNRRSQVIRETTREIRERAADG
jgi:hypothetical protein